MSELGPWLRETREAQGSSLAEAEARTRIRQKFLAALEAEEWARLPGEVTSRGFLRKYAAYLGLDPKEAIERYQAAMATRPRAKKPDQAAADDVLAIEAPAEREVDYRPIEVNLIEVQPRRAPWGWIAAAVLILAAAAAAWWIFTFRPGWIDNVTALLPAGQQPTLVSTPQDSAVAAAPTATPIVIRVTATHTSTPLPTPTHTATATPLAEPTGTGGPGKEDAELTPEPTSQAVRLLLLQLDATQRAWVRVVVDGQVRLETILEAGEGGEWEAQQAINLRTGNAAGIQVRLNGEPRGALGGAGEVIELSWTLEDGQLIESTPAPTSTLTSGQAATADAGQENPSPTPEPTSQAPQPTGSLEATPVASAEPIRRGNCCSAPALF